MPKHINNLKVIRRTVVAQLLKRGFTVREMAEEIKSRLDLKTCSTSTVAADIKFLLAEWRQTSLMSTDEYVQLELQRIDDIIKESWDAWDKSKMSYEKKKAKQHGVPTNPQGSGGGSDDNSITMTGIEQSSELVSPCGDPRYLDIIHKAEIERRKLLGLYTPVKQNIDVTSGGDTIAQNLKIEIIDKTEDVDDEVTGN
jgi:hypothetical protein